MPAFGWSYTFAPTSSGNIDTGHQDGDDGTPAIPLGWNAAFPSLIGLSAPFSVVPRAFLAEPFPGAASITLRTVSGDDALGAGWTYPDETLSNGAISGAGVLALDASYNGRTVNLIRPWSRLVAGGADTVAPTIPIITASGTGPVILTAEPISDVYVPGETTRGARRINWKRNGLAIGTTDVAPSILGQPSLIAFGATTASYAQTGKHYEITANGAAGFNGASDEGVMLAWPVTGNFIATVKLVSHPGAVSNVAHAGLMVRDSSAANSAFYMMYVPPDPTVGAKQRGRLSPGATPVVGTSVANITAPCQLRVIKIGDTLFGYYWNGAGWSFAGSLVIPMAQTVLVGPPLASRGASVQTTIYEEFSVSGELSPTFTDGVPLPGPNVYAAASDDLGTPANVSDLSVPVAVTIASTGEFTYRLHETYDDGIVKPAKWNTVTAAGGGLGVRAIQVVNALGGNALVQGLTRRGTSDFRMEEEAVGNGAIALNFQEVWYEFDVWVDPTSNYVGLATLFQIHHRSTPVTSGSNAPVNLYIENGAWGLWTIYWDDLLGQNGGTNRQTDRYRAGTASDLGPAFHTLTKGVKVHFKFHIKWNPRVAGDGFFEGFKDGVSFLKKNKAIGYGDYIPPGGGPTIVNNYNAHIGFYGIGSTPFAVDTNDKIIVAHKNYKEWNGSNPNGVPA